MGNRHVHLDTSEQRAVAAHTWQALECGKLGHTGGREGMVDARERAVGGLRKRPANCDVVAAIGGGAVARSEAVVTRRPVTPLREHAVRGTRGLVQAGTQLDEMWAGTSAVGVRDDHVTLVILDSARTTGEAALRPRLPGGDLAVDGAWLGVARL